MSLCVWLLTFWQGGAVQLILLLQLASGLTLYIFLCTALKLQGFIDASDHLRSGMTRGMNQHWE
jgi:hypothetical protein